MVNMVHINKILEKINNEIDNIAKKYSYDIQEEGEESKTAGFVDGFEEGAKTVKKIFIDALEIEGIESEILS